MIEIFWILKPTTMCWVSFQDEAEDVFRTLSVWRTVENLNKVEVLGRNLATLMPDALEESRLYLGKLEKWDLLAFMRDQLESLKRACEMNQDARMLLRRG